MAFLMGLGMTNAQDIKFGAKTGLNFANVSNVSYPNEKSSSRIAFHLGAMAEIKLNEQFAIQPELLYSAQGFKRDGVRGVEEMYGYKVYFDADVTAKMTYINVPVMAKYFVMEGLSLEAGPQLGILVSATGSYDNIKADGGYGTLNINPKDEDIKDDFSSIDFGLNFGASYTYNNIYAGLRYNLGLTNITKDSRGDVIKNGVLQFSVGYFF